MKKVVLPGDHLSSAEEAEVGANTYSDKDEVYSAALGENLSEPGKALVKTRRSNLVQPSVGTAVYCLITKASINKAIAGCISVSEAEGGGRGMEFEAVLPVTAIRSGYVDSIRDEVKIGDIIKGRIEKVTKTGVDISMNALGCGVICAFCPRCRQKMGLKESIFICSSCGWKERRKLPNQESGGGEMRDRRRPPRRDFRKGGY
jgi:exosome complex component CSL4